MAARTLLSVITALGGLTAAELAAGSVGASEIIDGSVGSDEAAGLVAGDLNLTGAYNFTNLQVGGVSVVPGQNIYYVVVKAATTANVADLAAGAPDPVDGVSLSANDDLLVWMQTSVPTNGVYNADTVGTGVNGAWTRAVAQDTVGELPVGMLVYVQAGTLYGQKLFRLTTAIATLGTNDAIFEEVQEGLRPINSSGEPEVMVGTVNSSNLNFDFNAVGAIIMASIFFDGVLQPPGNYALSAGAGAGGADRIVFGAGNYPLTGQVVEAIGFIST